MTKMDFQIYTHTLFTKLLYHDGITDENINSTFSTDLNI